MGRHVLCLQVEQIQDSKAIAAKDLSAWWTCHSVQQGVQYNKLTLGLTLASDITLMSNNSSLQLIRNASWCCV